ncbi:MAG: glucose-6-phosphate isomerase, partial [Gammaproteobacteria bacterium]|nr:glucose-6-phosphate isomerase [Gammaproteobacteria bacterium]
MSRRQLAGWKLLEQLAQRKKSQHMNQLFIDDPLRFEKFSIELPTMLLDYSKNLIDSETMKALVELATATDVECWRDRMFNGEPINLTEDRAVLHTALRGSATQTIEVDGQNINNQIKQQLTSMKSFVERLRRGDWLGYSGKRITDIVNIGVGGSNLGPKMVTEALKHYSDNT